MSHSDVFLQEFASSMNLYSGLSEHYVDFGVMEHGGSVTF